MQITTFGARETNRVIYVGMDFSNRPLWVDFSGKVRIQTAAVAAAYKKPEAALGWPAALTDLIPSNVWFAVSWGLPGVLLHATRVYLTLR